MHVRAGTDDRDPRQLLEELTRPADVRPVQPVTGGVVPRPVDLATSGVRHGDALTLAEGVEGAGAVGGDAERIGERRGRNDADPQTGKRPRTQPDGNRAEIAPRETRLEKDRRDALRQQLAVPTCVDDDAFGYNAVAHLDQRNSD